MKRIGIVSLIVAAASSILVLALLLGSSRTSVRRSLVYATRSSEGAGSTIWRANVDGKHPVPIGSGSYPKISPDGLIVAFVRASLVSSGHRRCETDKVFVMHSDGGKAEFIGRIDVGEPDLVWAPDSRYLAIAARENLHLIDFRTGSQKMIANTGGSPSFSPDSRSLVYAAESGKGFYDLFVTDLRRGGVRQITHLGNAGSPVWGPTEIAFRRGNELWLIDGKGENLHQLGGGTIVGEEYGAPAFWSADGGLLFTNASTVFAFDNYSWRSDVEIVVPNGGVRFSSPGSFLGLSRDGTLALINRCAFGPKGLPMRSNRGGVEAVPLNGGKPWKVVPGNSVCAASWNR